jgi:hypothetical protein
MDSLTTKQIDELRAALKPLRERFDLKVVMVQWATHVKSEEPKTGWVKEDVPSDGSNKPGWEEDGFVWDGSDDPIASLTTPPRRPHRPRTKRLGRLPADAYGAMLLAVVFHEYTGRAPTPGRQNARTGAETSPFYRFAAIAFRLLLRRTAPWAALLDTCERWERSRGFSKEAMKTLLFGGLVPTERERLPRPRKKKVATDF